MTRRTSYKSPPEEHKFQKGQSGNSRGRSKGVPNKKTIMRRIASETHTVAFDGKNRTLNTFELLIYLLRKKAMKGDVRADIALERIRDRFAPNYVEAGYLLAPEPLSQEEWVEQQEKLNAIKKPPKTARNTKRNDQ